MINTSRQVINLQEMPGIFIAVCLIEEVNNLVKDDYVNFNSFSNKHSSTP